MKTQTLLSNLRRTCLLLLPLTACTPKAEDIGALPGDGSGDGDSGGSESGTSDDPGDTGLDETGGGAPESVCDEGEGPAWPCCSDPDRDDIPLSLDNAGYYYNPAQRDTDQDGIGDVIDLCPTVADMANTADSDRDGVGNACDVCPSTASSYNTDWAEIAQQRLWVRNNPRQTDADGDGVGDVCDNCPSVANCADEASCQLDADSNGVGDACDGMQAGASAGPIGLAPGDDLDQDGLRNDADACPRLPLDVTVDCSDDASVCLNDSACTDGVCNHVDSDGDGVGNSCDSCVGTANGDQVHEGQAQIDDEDGDFVGQGCETSTACADRVDPAPTEFHPVAVGGHCCVQVLVADGDGQLRKAGVALSDPDGLPIRLRADCTLEEEDALQCRALPASVEHTPGVVTLPSGCEAALAEAGISAEDNLGTNALDMAGNPYDQACLMPQVDQDFDGLGDVCDLCPFAFDPGNEPFISVEGQLFPNDGRYCNGEYDIGLQCFE